MEVAERFGLEILEDSCETMFARYEGKPVGSFGTAACFSTYVAHLLVTGVGGFVTTNDPEMAIGVRSFLNHGRDSIYLSIDDDQGVSGEELRNIISRRFKFIRTGHSFRCTEFEAALGLAQIEEYETIIEARSRNASYFLERLRPLEEAGDVSLPIVPTNAEHMFMMFPVIVHRDRKTELVNHLEEGRIETRDLMPILTQPVCQEIFGDLTDKFPVASYNSTNGFYMGCHQFISERNLEYMADRVLAFFGRA